MAYQIKFYFSPQLQFSLCAASREIKLKKKCVFCDIYSYLYTNLCTLCTTRVKLKFFTMKILNQKNVLNVLQLKRNYNLCVYMYNAHTSMELYFIVGANWLRNFLCYYCTSNCTSCCCPFYHILRIPQNF